MAVTLQRSCKEHAFVPIFFIASVSVVYRWNGYQRFTIHPVYYLFLVVSIPRNFKEMQAARWKHRNAKHAPETQIPRSCVQRSAIGFSSLGDKTWERCGTVCGSFSYVKFNCIRSCDTGWQNFRSELRLRRRKRIGRVVWRDSPGNFDKTSISWYGWLKTVTFSAWLSRCPERFLRNFQTGDCIAKDYDKRFVQLLFQLKLTYLSI